MVSRFKMSLVGLFTIGVLLALIMTTLIYSLLGFPRLLFSRWMLFLIFTVLVAILLESPYFLSSSSAAPPACLDGFIIETNGGTGEAYTCTPLDH